MMPVTRQCCGVSAVAATTRDWIVVISLPLNPLRLSQVFLGAVVATLYPATEVFALANGCAAAGAAAQITATVMMEVRMDGSFKGSDPWHSIADLARPYLLLSPTGTG